MTQKIDIYVARRLVDQFCKGGCYNRGACNPKDYQEQSGLDATLAVRVVGEVLPCVCPIMLRVFPRAGWAPAGEMCEYSTPGT